MKVSILRAPANDSASYIAEMISLWAGNISDIVESIDEGNAESHAVTTVIVPFGVDIDAKTAKLHLDGGSHIIFVAPRAESLKGVGAPIPLEYGSSDSLWYLRLVRPLLSTFSHHAIPVLGKRLEAGKCSVSDLPRDATVWAYMYSNSRTLSDEPAIWTMNIGRGKVSVFAYDITECFRNLRQGFPENAGAWQPRDDNFRAAFLFGRDWSANFDSNNLPLADFHPLLLLHLIEMYQPVTAPRLWQLPGTYQSAVLISGDEDIATPEEDEEICSFLDTIGANMTIYIMPWITKCTKQLLSTWMNNGHNFSVHPYPTNDMSNANGSFSEYKDYIEKTVAEFQRKFSLPVRTLRNHRLYWSNYTDLPELWEKLGIEMDCNYGYNFVPGNYGGFFSTPAGSLPMSFLDAEFQRVEVLQQPCHLGDDVVFHQESEYSLKLNPESAEAYAAALIENTLKPLGTVFAVCFHPSNYATFAGEAERRFLTFAKANGVLLISDAQWLDFWQMRRSWKLVDTKQTAEHSSFIFEGEVKSAGLCLSIPAKCSGRDTDVVEINGNKAHISIINHVGQTRLLVALPDGINRANVSIHYSDGES